MKLLYFTASWCQPCKVFKPVVIRVTTGQRIPLEIIDIDQNEDTALLYGIKSVPTLMEVDDDTKATELWRLTGVQSEAKLREFLKQYWEEIYEDQTSPKSSSPKDD